MRLSPFNPIIRPPIVVILIHCSNIHLTNLKNHIRIFATTYEMRKILPRYVDQLRKQEKAELSVPLPSKWVWRRHTASEVRAIHMPDNRQSGRHAPRYVIYPARRRCHRRSGRASPGGCPHRCHRFRFCVSAFRDARTVARRIDAARMVVVAVSR